MNGHALTADASPLPPRAAARAVPAIARSRVREAIAVFAAWALVALISAGFSAANRIYTNMPADWGRAL
ncbi:MAG: hypothetical protein ABR567_04795, partial [Myxococcales bacterium]